MIPSKPPNNLVENVLNWFWVILLIGAILFLKTLLTEMHTETARLSEEREQFQEELRQEREKSKEVYQEFYSEINAAIRGAIEAINKGKIPSPYQF